MAAPVTAVQVGLKDKRTKKLLLRNPEDIHRRSEPLHEVEQSDNRTRTPGVPLVPAAIATTERSGWDQDGGQLIFCVASLFKQMLVLTFLMMQGEGAFPDISLATLVQDAYNEPNVTTTHRELFNFERRPELGHLTVHYKAFAPATRFLISPDGDFVASDEEIAERITEITVRWMEYTTRIKNETVPDHAYSNVNAGLLALIMVRRSRQSIHKLMSDNLFKRIGMERTFLGPLPSDQINNNTQGFRMSGDGSTFFPAPAHDYSGKTIALATVGCWSCTDDLSKFYKAILDGYYGRPGPITNKVAKEFLAVRLSMDPEPGVSPAGYSTKYPSHPLACDSSNRAFKEEEKPSSGERVRALISKSLVIHTKGGTADGFTSTMCLCATKAFFVVVLCNCTGPVDFSDLFARCITQELLYGRIDDVLRNEIGAISTHAPQRWQSLEQQDIRTSEWQDNMAPFRGIFQDRVTMRYLEISDHYAIVRKGNTELYRTRVGARGKQLRLFPLSRGLFVDRVTDWEDLTFELQESANRISLIGDGGAEVYVKQET